MATIESAELAQLRLLQLASPALPVGAYAFSQGLEYAIDSGLLDSAEAVSAWLSQQLCQSLALVDLPVLARIIRCAADADWPALEYWNDWLLASRETCELRLGDTATGLALHKLASELGLADAGFAQLAPRELSFCTAFGLCCQHWKIDSGAAQRAFAWSFLENQVAAASKLLPLGQSAAQRLLCQLAEQIPAALRCANRLGDEQLGGSLPALAIASCHHQHQYSRLFRS